MIGYEKLKDYEYVSFDLFDTLIFRSFSAYDKVFEFVEYKYNLSATTRLIKFSNSRIKAEKRARRKKNYREVNLDEIYDEFEFDLEQKSQIKEIEKRVEVDTSLPNEELIQLLSKLHIAGKKIIIITDMYLPKETISAILIKHNIYADYVFVSGEEKETKHQGNLFLRVLDSLNINKSELIHIGDNPVSDYCSPMNLGIKAVQYKKEIEEFPYLIKKGDILVDHYNSIIKNGFRNRATKYEQEYKMGFTVMGPVITSFCNWTHKIKEEKKLDALWFLAREGYAIKKVYETLYPNEVSNNKYVRINKHIMRIPLLTEKNLIDLLKSTLKDTKQTTWLYVLQSLGITDKDKGKIVLPNNHSFTTIIDIEDLNKPLYSSVRRSILDIMTLEINRQAEFLLEYLKDIDIDKKVGMVNNSYSGNGQKLLTEFVNKYGILTDLFGLQFAANKKCKNALNENFASWSDNKSDSFNAYLFERGSLIFEHLLFEPSGTAVKLERNSAGHVVVLCEKTRTEQKDFEKIAAFQAGMLDFAILIKNNMDCDLGFKSMQYFVNLIQNPTKEDALTLGSLNDDDADLDRVINDYSAEFSIRYLYKNDIYNRISWVQGFLVVKGLPDIYRKVFNLRLWMTHLFHIIREK